ncbi:hypothetical protein H4R99_007881, partial [Coemansia sp. RSA 1722]
TSSAWSVFCRSTSKTRILWHTFSLMQTTRYSGEKTKSPRSQPMSQMSSTRS